MGQTVRTFISVKMPITDKINAVSEAVKCIGNVKPVPSGQIHVTLCFLGDVDETKIPRLCSSLESEFSDTDSFDVTVKGMGAFPDAKHARVIWLGIDDKNKLSECSEKTIKAVKKTGLKYDGKKFVPHVTLARSRDGTDIRELISKYKDEEFCSFHCSSVNVMKSELTPKGARHTVIKCITLKESH